MKRLAMTWDGVDFFSSPGQALLSYWDISRIKPFSLFENKEILQIMSVRKQINQSDFIFINLGHIYFFLLHNFDPLYQFFRFLPTFISILAKEIPEFPMNGLGGDGGGG